MKKTTTICSALLASIANFLDLESILQIPEEKLRRITSSSQNLYREIKLKKKNAGERLITAPDEDLKIIQRAILDSIFNWEPLPASAYGFGKNKTIVDNARLHSKNPYVLNADIKNFFPSVHFTRVDKLYRRLGATDFAARTLTSLTTVNSCLPQGSPTSPYIATLSLRNMDYRIAKLCKANRLTFSRYFDDITISGHKRAHEVLQTVAAIVAQEGYELHRDLPKLQLFSPGQDRLITGIVIKNGVLCVSSKDEIMQYILSLQAGGLANLDDENPTKEMLSLLGKIGFVAKVDPVIANQLKTEFDKIEW